ncbi:hypothetical protein, partial [Akkermansia sp.]|uniref:hypothetical protein n=1 Tax=Akkermansia sp. TaxID=1872421 RepID=UPI003AB28400
VMIPRCPMLRKTSNIPGGEERKRRFRRNYSGVPDKICRRSSSFKNQRFSGYLLYPEGNPPSSVGTGFKEFVLQTIDV